MWAQTCLMYYGLISVLLCLSMSLLPVFTIMFYLAPCTCKWMDLYDKPICFHSATTPHPGHIFNILNSGRVLFQYFITFTFYMSLQTIFDHRNVKINWCLFTMLASNVWKQRTQLSNYLLFLQLILWKDANYFVTRTGTHQVLDNMHFKSGDCHTSDIIYSSKWNIPDICRDN